MHMKESGRYCCTKSRRCGSVLSTRHNRIAIRKGTDKSGASLRKSPSTSSEPRESDSSERPRISPQRQPSTISLRRPSTSSQRRTKREEHENCANLMSQTLLSVAAKLEKAFNDSENPYPKVKRVYVIRFDDKSSGLKKSHKKYTRVLYERKPRGKEIISKMRRPARSVIRVKSPSPASEGARSHTASDRSGDAPDGHPYRPYKNDFDQMDRKKISRSQEELQSEVEDAVEASNNSQRGNIRLEEHQNSEIVRNRLKSFNKTEIADIFGAIFNQIGNLSTKREGLASSPRKTLSQIIDSNDSLVSSDYTIPPSMINKDAIDILQALIDHKSKSEKIGREDRKSMRSNQKPPTRLYSSVDCYVMRQPWSYQTQAINDLESNIGASSSAASSPICRICHERLGTLVRPCRCRGSMAYVHVECLETWLTEKGINYCEVCHYVFRVIHVPEYKLIPSIGFWYKFAATNQQRKRIMVDLTLAVILLPFLIFVTLFARSWNPGFPGADLDEDREYDDALPNLGWILLAYAFKLFSFLLNLFYVASVFVRINHHLATWLSWYVNKNVTVVLEDRRHGSARTAGYGDDRNRPTPE